MGLGTRTLDHLTTVHFHCRECGRRFESAPLRVTDAPDLDHHPFEYAAECPDCGAVAEQAAWERALMKAHACATGPKTDAGKAASAANLEGHPTPEEAKLTRFNGMKHGLYARTATYFPAKPGKYARCESCEHLSTLACLVPPRACLKRHELMLRHQIAFETQDPDLLMQIRSDTQAAIQGLIDDMILAIAQDGGPRIQDVVWYHDKDGGFHLAKWIDENAIEHQILELKAHPLLKPLMEFISKNAMTMADLEMTPKAKDDQAMMEGYLDQQGDRQDTLVEYQQRQTLALEHVQGLIARSQERLAHDPVLIEHGGVEGEADA